MRHSLAYYGLKAIHRGDRTFLTGTIRKKKQGHPPIGRPARDRQTVSRYSSSHDFKCFDLSGFRTKMAS